MQLFYIKRRNWVIPTISVTKRRNCPIPTFCDIFMVTKRRNCSIPTFSNRRNWAIPTFSDNSDIFCQFRRFINFTTQISRVFVLICIAAARWRYLPQKHQFDKSSFSRPLSRDAVSLSLSCTTLHSVHSGIHIGSF